MPGADVWHADTTPPALTHGVPVQSTDSQHPDCYEEQRCALPPALNDLWILDLALPQAVSYTHLTLPTICSV
eukprot:1738488-Rhodomonas_salina.4